MTFVNSNKIVKISKAPKASHDLAIFDRLNITGMVRV
jgi:hypothetical protein